MKKSTINRICLMMWIAMYLLLQYWYTSNCQGFVTKMIGQTNIYCVKIETYETSFSYATLGFIGYITKKYLVYIVVRILS